MPYDVGGVVEPVALTIALDDWAKSVRRWELVLNEKAPVTDLTPDGRKRKRFFSNGVEYMDLIDRLARRPTSGSPPTPPW